VYKDNKVPISKENKPIGNKKLEIKKYNFAKTNQYTLTKTIKIGNFGTIAKNVVTIIGEPS